MKCVTRSVLLLLTYLLFYVNNVCAQDIAVTYIGNCAFKIQLGDNYLFSDFPYKPGAYGYMVYNLDSVYHNEPGIALLTHKHNDHYNGRLFRKTALQRVGPKITRRKLNSIRTKYGVAITPTRTKHTFSFNHRSHAVQWQNRRMYFSGDTESYEKLLSEPDFDILFITPWLVSKMQQDNIKLKAKTIILYHHTAADKTFRRQETKICDCEFIAPEQNSAYTL